MQSTMARDCNHAVDRLPSIACLKPTKVVAMSGILEMTRSSSRSMYYNLLHAWGLLDVLDESTTRELVESTHNEDDLRNVL